MLNLITCISCNSQNVIKHGKTSAGLPRYKCKDCKKTWTHGAVQKDRPSMDQVVSMYFDGHSTRDLVPIYRSSPSRINNKIREFLCKCPSWENYLDRNIESHSSSLILLTGINFSCNCEHDDCNNNFLAIAVDAVSSMIIAYEISINYKLDVWDKLLTKLRKRNISSTNFIFNGDDKISLAINKHFPDSRTHISILKKIRRKEIINSLKFDKQSKTLVDQTLENFKYSDNKTIEKYLSEHNTNFTEILNENISQYIAELKKFINDLKNNIDNLIQDFKDRFERFHMLKCEPTPIVNGWVAYQMLKPMENGFNRLSLYKGYPEDSNFKKFTEDKVSSKLSLDNPNLFSFEIARNILSIPISILNESKSCYTFTKILETKNI